MSLELNKTLQMLHEKIEERSLQLQNVLVKGGAKDYAEYREMVGKIRGFSESQRSINEVYIETVEGDEDE